MLRRWAAGILGGLLMLSIVSYVWLGSYSRMIADDYCTAATGNTLGIVDGTIRDYNTWAGLITNSVIKNALAPLQPEFHSIQTLLLVLVLLPAVAALLWQCLTIARVTSGKPLLTLQLTLLLGLVILYGAPTPRSIFWFATLIPYVYPIVLVFAGAALVAARWRQGHSDAAQVTVVLCIAMFVMMTSANIYLLPVLATGLLLAGWVVWTRITQQRVVLVMIGLVLLTALMSFAIVFVAPGNAIRQALILETSGFTSPSVGEWLDLTLSITSQALLMPGSLSAMLFAFFGTIVFLYLASGADARQMALWNIPRAPGIVIVLLLGWMLAGVVLTVATSVYGVGVVSTHTLFLPSVMQYCGASAIAYICVVWAARRGFPSLYLQRRPIFRMCVVGVMGMMVVVPLILLSYNLGIQPRFQQYAQDWDARHTFIETQVAAGNQDTIVVPPYRYSLASYMALDDIDNADGFTAACAAAYYGIRAIAVLAP